MSFRVQIQIAYVTGTSQNTCVVSCLLLDLWKAFDAMNRDYLSLELWTSSVTGDIA